MVDTVKFPDDGYYLSICKEGHIFSIWDINLSNNLCEIAIDKLVCQTLYVRAPFHGKFVKHSMEEPHLTLEFEFD